MTEINEELMVTIPLKQYTELVEENGRLNERYSRLWDAKDEIGRLKKELDEYKAFLKFDKTAATSFAMYQNTEKGCDEA